MEIKLKSEFFKSIYDSETITKEDIERRGVLPIVEDKNSPKINSKMDYRAILDDYATILSCNPTVMFESFSYLPNDLLKQILKIGLPADEIRIFQSKFDFSIFDSFDDSKFANIERLTFSDIEGRKKKSKFRHAKNLKELTELSIYDCANLDIDAFLQDLPEPDKLDSLTISSNLPSKEIMSKFTNITDLRIQNISDSQALIDFLDGICLENLTNISIINCNLENMPESLISRLSSLTSLFLNHNRKIDYNKIFSVLPNKTILKTAYITGLSSDNPGLDINLLNSCSNLDHLHLDKMEIDFNALREFLKSQTRLRDLDLLYCGVEDLDFLSDARKDINIKINEEDIDFKILTPEIARQQSSIELKKMSTSERIQTYFDKDNIYASPTLKAAMEINASTLDELKPFIADVDEITYLDITIEDSELFREWEMPLISDVVLGNLDKLSLGYSIIVPSFSMIGNDQLESLNVGKVLHYIKVMDLKCDDSIVSKRFSYNPNQYKTLKEIIEKLTQDIPEDLPELEKFMIIYRRLGASISYDYGIVGKNEYSEYAKKNVDDCRNCVNGLLRHTCVCAGFADILYNCLREVGIESYKISGIARGYHQWNKVKIDGKFYNVDLTWDIETLASELPFNLMYCLLSDKKFYSNHKMTNGKRRPCPQDYNREELKKALIKAMEFDGIKPKNLFTYISENVGKGFMKLFQEKKAKALPASRTDTVILQTQKDEECKEKKPSWDLGEDAQEVKKKMATITSANPTNSHNTDKNIEFDD